LLKLPIACEVPRPKNLSDQLGRYLTLSAGTLAPVGVPPYYGFLEDLWNQRFSG
jgi:hypothetical protein